MRAIPAKSDGRQPHLEISQFGGEARDWLTAASGVRPAALQRAETRRCDPDGATAYPRVLQMRQQKKDVELDIPVHTALAERPDPD